MGTSAAVKPSWEQELWGDLKPTPGRLSNSLRIVAASVIALIALLALQMPFISLGLYFIFLIGRDTPSVSLRTSLIFMFVVATAILVEMSVVILTDNSPVARVLSVAMVTFVAGLIMFAAPAVGAIASAWGFIFCTLIALWERPLPANAVVKASLYLAGTAALALTASVVVEFTFGARNPSELLAEQRGIRYQALTAMFSSFARGAEPPELAAAISRVARLAGAGQSGMLRLYNAIVDRNLPTGNLPIGSRPHISMLAQIMDVSAAFGSQHPSGVDLESRERCRKIGEQCRGLIASFHSEPSAWAPVNVEQLTLLDRVEWNLKTILSMPQPAAGDPGISRQALVALPSKKVPLIKADAVRSPHAAAFALKISLCATLCYIFYFAVNWPGISTAVTTVLITGLTNTGATKQKILFRFVGSAIGGLILGLGSTAFIFPYMDSITSLVILVGLVAFGSAWWSLGRRFSYVGLQIALSFYLVAFEGLRAPTELAPARDRLVGIVVALVVMWFVFDQLWPVRTITSMRQAFASVLRNQAVLFRLDERDGALLPRADALRDEVGKTVASLRSMNDAVAYEFGANRQAQMHASEVIVRGTLAAVAMFWNQLVLLHSPKDVDFQHEPHLVNLRSIMASTLDAMAEAVVQDREFVPTPIDNLTPRPLSARYREYVQNAVERFQELQAIVSSLTVRA